MPSSQLTAASNEMQTRKQRWRNKQSVDIWGWCHTPFQRYVTIAITFAVSFISLLEGHIKLSLKLVTAKRKPKLREQRNNEEIISSNSLPHHTRARSFMNKHEAAQLHLLPMLSRYKWVRACSMMRACHSTTGDVFAMMSSARHSMLKG
jgi:hypothetical protein